MKASVHIRGSIKDADQIDILLDSLKNILEQLAAADESPRVVKSIDFGTIGMTALGTLERAEEDG